ncbi:MAG TPA: hypothetical protein VK691_09855 [Solirubrobacteraceae bacterium]|jgi:hypothetical protein|nr:hypothetical protein [Solirubrobacteraceae bacterium]
MDDTAQPAASRWRQALAALVDVTLTGALAWSLRTRIRDERLRWLRPEDPEAVRARQALAEELKQINLADDPNARRAAMRRAMESHAPPPVYPAVLRIMGTGLATALINRRLRKRLAPTRQVRVRGIGPHSP